MAKTTTLFLLLFFISSNVFAESSAQPPAGVIDEYNLALKAYTTQNSIEAMQKFWSKQTERSERFGYEDAAHARYVRLASYRLVELYLKNNDTEKALDYLEWLEKNDTALE